MHRYRTHAAAKAALSFDSLGRLRNAHYIKCRVVACPIFCACFSGSIGSRHVGQSEAPGVAPCYYRRTFCRCECSPPGRLHSSSRRDAVGVCTVMPAWTGECNDGAAVPAAHHWRAAYRGRRCAAPARWPAAHDSCGSASDARCPGITAASMRKRSVLAGTRDARQWR